MYYNFNMEKVKDARNEVFNKSSMSVVELNNYVSIILLCNSEQKYTSVLCYWLTLPNECN